MPHPATSHVAGRKNDKKEYIAYYGRSLLEEALDNEDDDEDDNGRMLN